MIDASELHPDTTAGQMRRHLSTAFDTLDAMLGAVVLEMGTSSEAGHIVDLGQRLRDQLSGALAPLQEPEADELQKKKAG
jgi:hypothetical protein